MMEEYMTCSSRVVKDVRKLSKTVLSLELADHASVKKREMRDPSGHSTFETSTTDLRTLRSKLCRRSSSGRAMAATTTWKFLPADFVFNFSRTGELCYRSVSLPDTTSWTKSVID